MLNQKYISDLLLRLQVIKLALLPLSLNLPDLFIRMSLFSGETLPAWSCPSLPPALQIYQSCCLTSVSACSFSSGAAPEASSCNVGYSAHIPGYSMSRTGDSSPLRERKSHLNSPFLSHIKN